MRQVVRQVRSVPNIFMLAGFFSWPRILRCMTTLRAPYSARLLVGEIPGCNRNVKRCGEALRNSVANSPNPAI